MNKHKYVDHLERITSKKIYADQFEMEGVLCRY